MRVLFYSDNLYPEISGISDSIIALGRELKKRGHAVAFVGPRYSDANYAYIGKARADVSPLDDFEVCRIPSMSFGAAASGVARFVMPFGFSLPFVKRFRPDVIHTQSPFGTGIEAYIASRFFNIPLVGTNHTIIDQFIRIYGPIRAEWAVRLANRLFVLYYNRCISVSAPAQVLLDGMKSYGLTSPSEAVSNPTSLSLFSPATNEEKQAIRAELGLEGKVIIFSGRIAIEKKIDLLIKALAILIKKDPTIRLVIAGNGPVEGELKAYAHENGLEDTVIFTGFLDHATLAKWYKASDAFAIMSTIETQCLSLMQAFATALPCVGVDLGAVGHHIRPEFGYTIPDRDYEKLAEALEKILKNPQMAMEMGARALEYVKAFSGDTVADTWEKIYERSIKAKSDKK